LRIRAEYLVGCAGGRSLIRKAAGIEFAGWGPTTSYKGARLFAASNVVGSYALLLIRNAFLAVSAPSCARTQVLRAPLVGHVVYACARATCQQRNDRSDCDDSHAGHLEVLHRIFSPWL
jgi:FAD binding domain